jgi:hypothetical protein
MKLSQQIWCVVATFPVMVYVFVYVTVSIDPYWYDGKPTPELIPASERGGFALLITLFGFWKFLPAPKTVRREQYLRIENVILEISMLIIEITNDRGENNCDTFNIRSKLRTRNSDDRYRVISGNA